jgi:hypothetical protein
MWCVATLAVPQQSACLAKKVINLTVVVAVAQKLLMRKLGLLQSQNEIESVNFDHYIKLFAEGLSEVQPQLIRELFMDHVPAPELAKLVVITEE